MGLLAQERQGNIMEHLQAERKASVADLVGRFAVSEATVRRDLTELEKQGKVVKTYGGAILAEASQIEFSFQDRLSQRVDEKRRIGAHAAALVKSGDAVFLDSGTTTSQVAENLKDRDEITVVTNSLVIAQMLGACHGIRLYIVGGQYRPFSMDMLGPVLNETLKQFAVDIAFLSVDGFHADTGLYASDPGEAEAARAAIGISKRVVIVADSSKGGKKAFAHIGSFEGIDRVVSDKELAHPLREALERAAVLVELV